MSRRLWVWTIGAVGALIVLFNTFYVVDQREQAIVVRFGEPVSLKASWWEASM